MSLETVALTESSDIFRVPSLFVELCPDLFGRDLCDIL